MMKHSTRLDDTAITSFDEKTMKKDKITVYNFFFLVNIKFGSISSPAFSKYFQTLLVD